jgi:hypothetical protein
MIVYQLFRNVIWVLGAWCSLPFTARRMKGVRTRPNLLHSRFSRWETHIDSLHSQNTTFGYQQTDVRQILFSNKNKNWKKRLFSVWFAELTAFQCSKVLDVDDNMYPIS